MQIVKCEMCDIEELASMNKQLIDAEKAIIKCQFLS